MEGLTDILKTFDVKRTAEWGTELWTKADDSCKDSMIACWFKDIAFEVLNCGYFSIGKKFGIEPLAVELYYSEEDEGGYLDPIMYHINRRRPAKFEEKEIDFEYFEFGSLHLHASGVDVTFENPNKHYRASFLIREFTAFKIEEDGSHTIIYDKCPNSTFIFDYMFPFGVNSETMDAVCWERFDEPKSTKAPRQFHRKGVKQYEKVAGEYQFDERNRKYKDNGIQCAKPWKFIRIVPEPMEGRGSECH